MSHFNATEPLDKLDQKYDRLMTEAVTCMTKYRSIWRCLESEKDLPFDVRQYLKEYYDVLFAEAEGLLAQARVVETIKQFRFREEK